MVPTPNRPLRVCIVGIFYSPDSTGVAPYTAAMARAAAAAGFEVRVVTGVPHYPSWRVAPGYRWGLRWDERIDGVRVSRIRHWVPRRAGLLGRVLLEATFTLGTLPIIWRDRADLIVAITPSPGAMVSAAFGRRRRPVSVFVQDLAGNGASQSGTAGASVARFISSIEYWLIRRANRVGVIADRFASVLMANGVEAQDISVIANFTHVEVPLMTQADARKALGWDPDRFTVVHTGNMGMKQGLDTLVAAARIADQRGEDIQFVLVGDGNQRDVLHTAGAGCERLRFVAPVSAEDYPKVLLAADVLVVCERPGVLEMSLPSKITSYVAAGRPLLASVEAGGMTDQYLRMGGFAHIVAAGSPAALLEGALNLSADGPLRAELAARAGDECQRLSPQTAAEAYVAWMHEAIQSVSSE